MDIGEQRTNRSRFLRQVGIVIGVGVGAVALPANSRAAHAVSKANGTASLGEGQLADVQPGNAKQQSLDFECCPHHQYCPGPCPPGQYPHYCECPWSPYCACFARNDGCFMAGC